MDFEDRPGASASACADTVTTSSIAGRSGRSPRAWASKTSITASTRSNRCLSLHAGCCTGVSAEMSRKRSVASRSITANMRAASSARTIIVTWTMPSSRSRRVTYRRAHLRVRHDAAPERVVDDRQLAEPVCDPQLFPRGRGVHPESPRQPVRARLGRLERPALPEIEHSQIGEEAVHRGVEVRAVDGEPLTQRFHILLSRHYRSIADDYDN